MDFETVPLQPNELLTVPLTPTEQLTVPLQLDEQLPVQQDVDDYTKGGVAGNKPDFHDSVIDELRNKSAQSCEPSFNQTTHNSSRFEIVILYTCT